MYMQPMEAPLAPGAAPGAVRPLTQAGRASEAQSPERETPVRPRGPVRDEYVPEEPPESSGRYWPGRDENGQPRIFFDSRTQAEDAPEGDRPPPARGPERPDGTGEERCAGSTDQVDREIERLKKRQQELEQQLSAEQDEARRKDLERQLAQVERELRQKDNDAYRRQHASFTQLSASGG